MNYLKLVRIFARYPRSFFKNLSQENIYKYLHALRTEDRRKILKNIERYLSGERVEDSFSSNGTPPTKMIDFLSRIQSLKAKDPDEFILFVSHEATLTGAPLIIHQVARNFHDLHNIQPIFLLLKGGKIEELFFNDFPSYQLPDHFSEKEKIKEIEHLLAVLQPEVDLRRVYVNSAESRFILPVLKQAKVPMVISMVHEMGNLYPKDSWQVISRYSDHVVFPCHFVQQKALENCAFLPNISIKGQGLLKPEILDASLSTCRADIRKQLGIREDAKIVLSCGTPIARKGIDIFVFTAISTLARWTGSSPLYFLWIGDAPDNYYQQWSRRDIQFSDYADNIIWLDSKDDTVPWFVGSDLFFLTSRGDPFPCVVHEALAAGLQVVGFDNTGGLREMLPPKAALIQQYGDLAAASTAILSALQQPDPETRRSIIDYAKKYLDYPIYSEYLLEVIPEKIRNQDNQLLETERKLYATTILELPVPPLSHMHYNESEEAHLRIGKREVENIRICLQNSGYEFSGLLKVLEFGCSNCRLLRWFYETDITKELWGCDVDERMIDWGRKNLSEAINVQLNRHHPPLDFENDYFELIFAGSIFTHIDKNAGQWLDELTRITQPGGLLYLTFLDESSMRILATEPERPVYNRVANYTDAEKIWAGNFDKISIPGLNGSTDKSGGLVLCHSEYIKKMHHKDLELIQVMKKAYAGFQTAYLFRKKLS